jgi:hypothetical protein
MFFTKVWPTGVFGLVIVISRLVSGGCFAVVVLAPLCGRYLLSSVCWPLTLRMLCRQGCLSECFAAVVVVLSGGCFASVVAGSLTSLVDALPPWPAPLRRQLFVLLYLFACYG